MKVAYSDSSPAFPQYRAVAAQLASLPVEIVHKILSDIQVSRILALISIYPNTYLDECISSHLELRKLLPASYLPEIKKLTMINLRITPYRALYQQNTIYALEYDAQTLLQRTLPVVDTRFIRTVFASTIVDALYRFVKVTPVLQEYHDKYNTGVVIPPPHKWVPSIPANELDYIVSAVTTAVDGLKQQQSRQLLKFAELAREYHSMLKAINDPSQESRSESHRRHRVNLYEHLARTTLDRWRQPVCSIFSGRLFPLIPYDRYLHLFFKTLDRWPQSKHKYPPQLQVALDGMEYVYPRDRTSVVSAAHTTGTEEVPLRVPRIICNGRGHRTMHTLRRTTLYDDQKEPLDAYRPWPDAEFEWLESFVTVCRYMGQMQDKWYKTPNRTETVGDFWKKHLGNMK